MADGTLSIRDKAILCLLLYLGLRACDIASITFQTFDWKTDRLCLYQNKTGVPIVGNAVFDYITKDRPMSNTLSCQRGGLHDMIQFKSFLAPSIEDFIYFRKSSGNWNISSYEPNLKLFDAYVAENYPNDKILLQEIADIWCHKRTSEMNNSCRSRIYVVISFIKYLKERQSTDVMPPEAPKKEKRNYIPHDYSDDELDAFFRECDPSGQSMMI